MNLPTHSWGIRKCRCIVVLGGLPSVSVFGLAIAKLCGRGSSIGKLILEIFSPLQLLFAANLLPI